MDGKLTSLAGLSADTNAHPTIITTNRITADLILNIRFSCNISQKYFDQISSPVWLVSGLEKMWYGKLHKHFYLYIVQFGARPSWRGTQPYQVVALLFPLMLLSIIPLFLWKWPSHTKWNRMGSPPWHRCFKKWTMAQ